MKSSAIVSSRCRSSVALHDSGRLSLARALKSVSPDMAALPPDLVLADLKSPNYPAGPYSTDDGGVLPNFTFRGFFSPARTDGVATGREST